MTRFNKRPREEIWAGLRFGRTGRRCIFEVDNFGEVKNFGEEGKMAGGWSEGFVVSLERSDEKLAGEIENVRRRSRGPAAGPARAGGLSWARSTGSAFST